MSTMSNGAVGGNFATLVDLQASKPLLNTKVVLIGVQEYKVETVSVNGLSLANGLFANPVFNAQNIRYSLIDNPLCHLFKANNLSALSAPLNTNTDVTWARSTTATFVDRYGVIQTAAINEPREEKEGFLIEGVSTNLFLNSPVGVTQSVAITNGSVYTVSFNDGAGSITLTGGGTGVVTSSTDVTFTATSTSVTLTVSGQADKVNLESLPFSTSYIITAGAAATRTPDDVTIKVSNNMPLITMPWTLSCQFNSELNNSTSTSAILMFGDSANSQRIAIQNNGSVLIKGDSITEEILPQGTCVANQVHSLVVSYDGINVIGYVDGIAGASIAIVMRDVTGDSKWGDRTGSDEHLNGHLKDARIYDFALNTDEVIYLSGV